MSGKRKQVPPHHNPKTFKLEKEKLSFLSMNFIAKLPTEIHDLIKSFLPLPDQISFFYCRRLKFGSRLVEGKEQVEEAFLSAIARNKANVVQHLLKSYPNLDPSIHDNKAIREASMKGHVEIVKLLLADSRVDASKDDNLVIRKASMNGHVEVVKILLADERTDPSADYNYAIRWASINGHADIVKILLADHRVDPSAEGNHAIRMASKYGHVEVVKMLLADTRIDPAIYDNFAFRMASLMGQVEVVKILLADARINPSDDDNKAMRWASCKGCVEVVKILLADGRSDPNCAEVSSRNGVSEVDRLILADARVDKLNFFIKAVRCGNLDLVNYIMLSDPTIDISSHLNNPSSDLNEAIDYASKKGRTKIVEYLRTVHQSVVIGK